MINDSKLKEKDLYFEDTRLSMSGAGRLFVRLSASATYGISLSAAMILSFSSVSQLRAVGFLLILFLLDRLVHFGEADTSLAHNARLTARGEPISSNNKTNVAAFLTPKSYRMVEVAFGRARLGDGTFFLNLLKLLMNRRDIQAGMARMDVNVNDFRSRLNDFLNVSAPTHKQEEILEEVSFLIVQAFHQAIKTESDSIGPKDLFAAVAKAKDQSVVKLFSLFNIGDDDLENALIWSRFSRRLSVIGLPTRLTSFIGSAHKKRRRFMNRAWTARPTPFLDQYSEDITGAARIGHLGFMVGHAREYDTLTDVLSKPQNPNVLLVGETGSGKETILGRLAFQITHDRVPAPLFDRRLVSLSLGSLVAGAVPAEVQERVRHIIAEVESAGNIMLYIPDIHNLFKGGAFEVSAADVLTPALQGANFSVIGATTPREFKQWIEPNSEFAASFASIPVAEIREPEAVRYLVYQSLILEQKYKMTVSFKAVKEAVRLGHRYIRTKLLPASAEEILEEALADAKEKSKKILTADDIVAIVERKVNIPIHAVAELEAKKLLSLESLIHERLIDQAEAVSAVSGALREYRSGLNRKGGPIATFLFVGPTGVGKTELAKILTRIQFGVENQMLRFDMSEYQSKESFMRFIGSPDGGVRGALTDAVWEKPYSLILLDEFEKAHPDILNLFLQVFDDGRLTDNLNRTIDFSNTVIIATSNAHSEFIKTSIETATPVSEIAEQLKRKLGDYFKAELLNRFSGIIVFKPLSKEDIKAITKISLADLADTLRENQGIELQWSEDVLSEIARLGYDPVFGARPLRRVISEKLRSTLAEEILKGEISRGGTVKISFNGKDFQFSQV